MPVYTETLVPLELYEQHPLRAHHCRNMEMGMSQFTSPYCVQSNFRVVSWEVACTFLNKKHPGINILVAFSSWHVFFFLSLSSEIDVLCLKYTLYIDVKKFLSLKGNLDISIIFHELALVQNSLAPH